MQKRERAKVKLRDSCDRCSEAKTKCNKEKPVCSRCNIKGTVCCYGPSNRSGRRSKVASKAPKQSRKSPTPGPTTASVQVFATDPQPASTSKDLDSAAALNSVNTDFDFSLDIFDFSDIALDGAASATTPPLMCSEPSRMELSASESDLATLIPSKPESTNDSIRKTDLENGISTDNSNLSHDNRADSISNLIDSFACNNTTTNGNDSINSDIEGMIYDSEWYMNSGFTVPNNVAFGICNTPSSNYTPGTTLPDISMPSPLQPSIFDHQSFFLPHANTTFGSPIPKTSCTCLTQALSLLAALQDENSASSSKCPNSPALGMLTPPCTDNNVGATTSIHETLSLNAISLRHATSILNCECSTQNQQLFFFVAFIALKTMDRYTAAAHGADTLERDGGGKENSRSRAQLVLGELHQVARIVDTLSKRMRESSSISTMPSQSGSGAPPCPGGYGISGSWSAQLEKDLQTHLKAVANDAMAILRRK